MSLPPETFDYLQPSASQIAEMPRARDAAKVYASILDQLLPAGPDKTDGPLRTLREVAMWANVSLTRHADGATPATAPLLPVYPQTRRPPCRRDLFFAA